MSLSSPSRSRSLPARFVGIGLVAAAGLGTLPTAFAGTASTSMPISATVAPLCLVSASGIDFGNYDPLVANASSALTAQGTVTVQCIRNTSYSITLDQGQNGTATTRNMSGGGALMNYELYSDSAHSKVWNASSPVKGTATSLAPLAITVYGSIPAAQNVVPASYSDTVAVTVNF